MQRYVLYQMLFSFIMTAFSASAAAEKGMCPIIQPVAATTKDFLSHIIE